LAGVRRKSDLGSFLCQRCRKSAVSLAIEEVDVLRDGRRHDLLSGTRKRAYLGKISRGLYDAVITSPPCGTFSRSRWRPGGPRPLRLKHCPRGFPWLTGQRKASVLQANSFVDFSVDGLRAHLAVGKERTGVMEHPEDLGIVSTGDHPGCSWHFDNVRALGNVDGVVTGALAQSDWGRPYPKPTRLLGRLPGMQDMLYVGWPSFDDTGKYSGPLPPNRGNGGSMPVGRAPDGTFMTSSSAAWPPDMCEHLAKLLVDSFLGPLKAGTERHKEADKPIVEMEPNVVMKVRVRETDKDKEGQRDKEEAVADKDGLVNAEAVMEQGDKTAGATRRQLKKAELENLRCGRPIVGVYIRRGGGASPLPVG